MATTTKIEVLVIGVDYYYSNYHNDIYDYR